MSVQFFYDNAGFSHDPAKETVNEGRRRCAAELAAAEAFANDNDWYAQWRIDIDAERDVEGLTEESVAYWCELLNMDGHTLEVLCGIWDPTREYKRVVEAELALEAMSHRSECGNCGRPVSSKAIAAEEECRC